MLLLPIIPNHGAPCHANRNHPGKDHDKCCPKGFAEEVVFESSITQRKKAGKNEEPAGKDESKRKSRFIIGI